MMITAMEESEVEPFVWQITKALKVALGYSLRDSFGQQRERQGSHCVKVP
jgi:hypothetical protein